MEFTERQPNTTHYVVSRIQVWVAQAMRITQTANAARRTLRFRRAFTELNQLWLEANYAADFMHSYLRFMEQRYKLPNEPVSPAQVPAVVLVDDIEKVADELLSRIDSLLNEMQRTPASAYTADFYTLQLVNDARTSLLKCAVLLNLAKQTKPVVLPNPTDDESEAVI